MTDTSADERRHVIQNCKIDLRGAGYRCVAEDGELSLGAMGEGDKVMLENGTFFLDGLQILGPVAVAEIRADALWEALAAFDAPRPVKLAFRKDGTRSKNDICPHDFEMWRGCEQCIKAAILALINHPAQGAIHD